MAVVAAAMNDDEFAVPEAAAAAKVAAAAAEKGKTPPLGKQVLAGAHVLVALDIEASSTNRCEHIMFAVHFTKHAVPDEQFASYIKPDDGCADLF